MSYISTWLDRGVTLLTPRQQRGDRIARGSIRILILMTSVLAVGWIACQLIFSISGFVVGMWTMWIVLLLMIVQMLIVRATPRAWTRMFFFAICSVLFFAVMFYYTGGTSSPFVLSLFCLGPVLFLFIRRDVGYRWLAVASVLAVIIIVVEYYVEMPQRLSPRAYILTWMTTFVYNMVFVVLTIWLYKSASRRKRAQLKAVNANLIQANRDLESFAYIASHDLKTPLRSILSFVSLLERNVKDHIDDDGLEYIDIMSTNARQMNILVEDILEYSRVHTRTPAMSRIDLRQLLRIISQEISVSQEQQCSIVIAEDMPTIMADRALLKQALTNVIENGLKYNDSTIASVEITASEDTDGQIALRLSDNGIGIRPEYHERIFEMFERLHSRDDYDGTGIGLSIARRLLEIMDGTLSVVRSSPGEGTTLEMRLPCTSVSSRKRQDIS